MTTEQKVSLLQKLRVRLVRQRERLLQYLGLLEEEQEAGEHTDAERIRRQLETEQQIVSEVESFQRAIEPLEELYQRAYPREESEIPPLRTALRAVQSQVLERAERNARLLRPEGGAAAADLPTGEQLRSRERGREVYAESGTPTIIDIST